MNRKTILKSVVIIFSLIFIFIFISNEKSYRKSNVVSLNSTYTEYQNNPDLFRIAKAEIIEEFKIHSGQFPASRAWTVKFNIDEKTSVTTQVLRDNDEHIGDIIDIAYKIHDKNLYEDDYYDEHNTLATQLKYINDTNCMIAYNIIMILTIAGILGIIGRLLYLLFKKNSFEY